MVRTKRASVDPPSGDSELPDVSGLRSRAAAPREIRRPRKQPARIPAGQQRKQISLFVGVEDWRLLRRHAAQRDLPVTSIVLERVEPLLAELRRKADAERDDD